MPLKELCNVITKGTTPTTLGKSFTTYGINYIKAESITNYHAIDLKKIAFIDETTNQKLKRSILKEGDIIFTIAGTLGRFSLIDKKILPANTNQAIAIIRANREKISSNYLYSCFLGNWHNEYYSKHVQQAVQANLSLSTIKALPIPILTDQQMSQYLDAITPRIIMIKQTESENSYLENLRDTLLPYLISSKEFN